MAEEANVHAMDNIFKNVLLFIPCPNFKGETCASG